jgi:hypothetical protein
LALLPTQQTTQALVRRPAPQTRLLLLLKKPPLPLLL